MINVKTILGYPGTAIAGCQVQTLTEVSFQ
jgi:hypothetical protein